MNVGEMCTREVYVMRPTEPLLQAVHEMRKHNVGCMVVVEQAGDRNVPIGVLTDRDVVRMLPEKAAVLATTPVGDCITGRPFTIAETDSIVQAMAGMRLRGVRRAPVVAADGGLIGIVSIDDLVGIIAEQLSSLARLVERQSRLH